MEKFLVAKRHLGNTGLNVSIIGLGTVKIGRNTLVKNKSSDGFELPSDKEVDTLLDVCLEYGVNLIDISPAYGTSEERLGKLLGSRRNKFIISTKVGEEFDGEKSTYNFSKNFVTESVTRSLKRLKTSVLESVLLHCSRNDLDEIKNSSALEALSRLKEKGDILHFGASTNSIEAGVYAVENCDLVMVPYNKDYQEHLPVIKLAQEKNKGVLIKKGLMSGFLSENDPKNSVHECLKSIYIHPAVSSLVVGTINPNHLKENIQASLLFT